MTLNPADLRQHQPELDRPVAVRATRSWRPPWTTSRSTTTRCRPPRSPRWPAVSPAPATSRTTSSTRTPAKIALDSSGNGHNATIISARERQHAAVAAAARRPVITIPAGSTNVPVTSTSGFKVGQKMSIGYGGTLETATVTAVGTPGTQARLAAAAAAGATSIKVTSTANITAGDTIRLDIGSEARRSPSRRWAPPAQAAPASPWPPRCSSPTRPTFRSATGAPASASAQRPASRTPATSPCRHWAAASPSTSPSDSSHAINTPVVDAAVTNAGYQGTPAPDQWFGGPALSSSAGTHGAARRPRPGRRQPQLRRPRRPMGRRGLPGRVRSGAGRLLRADAHRPWRGQERHPPARRQRHRQQLR